MRGAGLRRQLQRRGRRWRTRWRAFRMPAGAVWPAPPPSPTVAGLTPGQQQRAVAEACRLAHAEPDGEVHCSVMQKSLGIRVRAADGAANWLKIAPKGGAREQWARAGERAAQALDGVPQPAILRELEWPADGAELHAFVYTLAPSPAAQRTPWISAPMPPVGDEWLTGLRRALDRTAAAPLSRWNVHPGPVARVVAQRFGRKAPYDVDEWRMAHGDLNWSNVTAPKLALLDWEFFGAAPRGYDAATLLLFTLSDPELYRRIEAALAEDLNSRSGLVSRLYVLARRLDKIEGGFRDPREHRPIEREAMRLLRL